MPNRIIKESICCSDDINKLSADEEVFFYRLIVNCDDYGRMDARLPILRAKLYPLREKMKASDIKKCLFKLSTAKPDPLIILYNVNGTQYIQMTKWDKHQQIRAHRSKYPAIEDGKRCFMIADDINGNQLIANVTVIQSNPIRIQSESNPIATVYFDNPELNNTFLSFIEFRTKIKAEMTDYAIELAVSKLNKKCETNEERIETLNNSIIGGYKGLFPKSKPKIASPQKKSIKDNFEQREYTDEVLESLYKNSD